LFIGHKTLYIETFTIRNSVLKSRCLAPNYTYNDTLALNYVKVWHDAFQASFDECPLNDEDNFELDNILEITETSLNNNETYQVKLNFVALENYLKKVNRSVRLNNMLFSAYFEKIEQTRRLSNKVGIGLW
jgi:hypothetical protein